MCFLTFYESPGGNQVDGSPPSRHNDSAMLWPLRGRKQPKCRSGKKRKSRAKIETLLQIQSLENKVVPDITPQWCLEVPDGRNDFLEYARKA